jgi:hypothetical protein
MNIGNFIRLVIVIAWLALFIPHIVHHVAPGLGLSQRGNAATMLSVSLGKEFLYDLVRISAPGHLGTCRMSFLRVENGFESETELRISDLGNLAPGLSLLPQMREQSIRAVRLQLTELLDARQHLLSLTANGSAFGMQLTAEGTIKADGLHGTYTLANDGPIPFHLPEIGHDAGQGSDLAMNLPPGLEAGDRFTTRLLTPDFTRMKLGATTGIFSAIAQEKCLTVAGERSLLKVEMYIDARLMSTLWCDENGVVYRSRQQNGSMEMRLNQIRMIGGNILWPPESATK